MTRLAILADIHGNYPALQAVIDDMQTFQPDNVIVAGDLINGAPFSREVVDEVRQRGWNAIRGNHEFYLLHYGGPRQPAHRQGWTMPPLLYAELYGTPAYHYLAALPDTLRIEYPDAPPIRVVHGLLGDHYHSLDRTSTDEAIREKLATIEEPVFIAGHYHLPFEKQVDPWHILNPGSVGLLLDGVHEASYLLLDSYPDHWEATFRRVPYPLEQVKAAFERTHFVEKTGVEGYLLLHHFLLARPVLMEFYRWKADTCPDEAATLAMVDEFISSPAYWDYLNPIYRYNLPDNYSPGGVTSS